MAVAVAAAAAATAPTVGEVVTRSGACYWCDREALLHCLCIVRSCGSDAAGRRETAVAAVSVVRSQWSVSGSSEVQHQHHQQHAQTTAFHRHNHAHTNSNRRNQQTRQKQNRKTKQKAAVSAGNNRRRCQIDAHERPKSWPLAGTVVALNAARKQWRSTIVFRAMRRGQRGAWAIRAAAVSSSLRFAAEQHAVMVCCCCRRTSIRPSPCCRCRWAMRREWPARELAS